MNLTGPNPNINTVVIIPARFDSIRLPGKALMEIAGKPMICHVVERAREAQNVGNVIVATDDARILDVVQQAGYQAIMTSSEHRSGTDRVAEVAEKLPSARIIVNVQGDEPLISPRTIDNAIDALVADEEAGVATTWEPLHLASEVLSPDVVKIVIGKAGRVLYFSRAPVPYPRDAVRRHGTLEAALNNEPTLFEGFRKHTGLYVFRREVLLDFARWPESELERAESLEQLRALEQGVKIKAVKAQSEAIGVDTTEDLEHVRRLMGSGVQTC
ncbi:MAG TPA: 3-deoxy-manno-octulosonate cytidylyltransferase [Pyrinomonadaceae bacterium]|nr:3-deoxy-manno-octulosonate cytidylyltransferase [Pyrinomonadaceae bacterium]